jgi:hypothetical protein
MRKKIIAQRSIFDQSIDQLNTLIRPERIFKQMDAIIDQNDGIVARIHKQLTDNVSNKGCRGMSAEQILRVALVRHLKQYSWRELAEGSMTGYVCDGLPDFIQHPFRITQHCKKRSGLSMRICGQ